MEVQVNVQLWHLMVSVLFLAGALLGSAWAVALKWGKLIERVGHLCESVARNAERIADLYERKVETASCAEIRTLQNHND